jgi:UDP-glucose 4-epimerase
MTGATTGWCDGAVLVTGGAGFVGSHLCEALVALGRRVRVLDDFSAGNAANLAHIWHAVELVEGSVESPHAVERAMRGVESVVHLAARTSVAESLAEPARYEAVNLGGTRRVLDAAAHARVRRVVFAASSSAYGTHDAPQDESMTPEPLSPYAATKVEGERLVRALAEGGLGTDAVSLRFFNIYGPRQDPNSAYAGVVARFATRVAAGLPVAIFGDGEQTRDFIHVSDAVRALVAALDAVEPLGGGVVNIGTGRATSVRGLADAVGAVAGRSVTVEFREARVGEVRHSVAATGRAARMLGFRAETALEAGLATMMR